MERWVDWFAAVAWKAGEATHALLDRIGATVDAWRWRTAELRADAAARSVLELLPGNPVLDGSVVARRLGVSERALAGPWRRSATAASSSASTFPPCGPGVLGSSGWRAR